MIIDFRLRPPVKPFIAMKGYTKTRIKECAKELGEIPDPAAMKRSTNLLIQEMDELEIVHAVCAGRIVPDMQFSTKMGEGNDSISKAVKQQYAGRFIGFAGIDHRDISQAITETERCVKQLGLKGINMDLGFFNDPPTYANDARLYPLYDYCQQANIPIMFSLSIRMGSDISHCHPLPIDQVARDFPKLTILISHACWPWVKEICGVCYVRQNIHLIPDFYGIGFPGHLQYVEAANTYLQDRVLFGSAFPLRNLKLMVEGHKALPFRPEVAEKYFYRNAQRLLGLGITVYK